MRATLAGREVPRLLGRRRQTLEPAVLLQHQVEVEQVVGTQRRPDPRLAQFGREPPHLHAHAARHEQVDDAPARFLGDRARALRALEAVRAPLVVGAHTYREVVGSQLHVPAARAVGPDRRHRITGPWSSFSARPPWLVCHTLRQPSPALESSGGSVALGHDAPAASPTARGSMAARGRHHLRPPRCPPRGARELAPGLPAGARRRATGPRDRRLAERPTARSSARTTRSVRSGLRRYRIAESTAAELAKLGVPRLADVYDELGTDFELSVDVKEPAAAPGAARGRAGATAPSNASGSASRICPSSARSARTGGEARALDQQRDDRRAARAARGRARRARRSTR